jgi:hypothetical protein
LPGSPIFFTSDVEQSDVICIIRRHPRLTQSNLITGHHRPSFLQFPAASLSLTGLRAVYAYLGIGQDR